MTDRPLHGVLFVSEEEIWAMENEPPPLQSDAPQFYCIGKNGHITFFPPLDPKTMLVFVCCEGDF